MVDIRELQKRGIVRTPKRELDIPTTKEGFVELPNSQKDNSSNQNFFGFMNNRNKPTPQEPQPNENSRIIELDNKIYKLEQRIELLEKKLETTQPKKNLGAMRW